MRLKNMVTRRRFDWLSMDESRPLPVSIPSMPLSLKIILVGERESLADFQEMEPEQMCIRDRVRESCAPLNR